MKLSAKLFQILPPKSGTSKSGPWRKQDIVVETTGKFQKKLFLTIWNDKINVQSSQIGELFNIDIDIDSNEFEVKWYNHIIVKELTLSNSDFLLPNIQMQLNANLVKILPSSSGIKGDTSWKKQEIIVQTTEENPRKICFQILNDSVDISSYETGDELVVFFEINSYEYNGKWYSIFKAWRIWNKKFFKSF